MTYPEIQFVAAPEDGAEVLFDFNDTYPTGASGRTVHEGFSLGAPSVTGDLDGLGVQYGPRTIAFTLSIRCPREQAVATQAYLARTFMLRRRGWLRIKVGEFSSPIWFRTYTPTPGELKFDLIRNGSGRDEWQIPIEVAAEPFARGERITLGSYEINNNPAHATNPVGVTLPAVVGDAPAPLRLTAMFSHTLNQHDILWSTAAVAEDYTPVVWEVGSGGAWTLGFDTGAPAADASFSGGYYRPVTFATQTGMATRLTGSPPSTPPPGRYKVMLRVGRDATASFAFAFGYQTANGNYFDGSPVTVWDRGASLGVAAATWVDLGEFEFPLPHTEIDMPHVSAAPQVALAVERLSGSASCLLDVFVLLPVDDAAVTSLESWEKADVLVSEFPSFGPQADGGMQVWDGDAEVSVRMDADGVLDALDLPASRGRYPTVRPGVSNYLTLLQQVRMSDGALGTTNNSDILAATSIVTVSYQPRWLWLGEG